MSCTAICYGQKALDSSSSFDFRKTKWGMSKEEVKESENFIFFNDKKLNEFEAERYGFDEHVVFRGGVNGKEVRVVYCFKNNLLVNTTQLFVEQYEDKSIYFKEYEYYKNLLIKKYGKPIVDEEIWQSRKYKGNPAIALDAGDLSFHACFEYNSKIIDIHLRKNADADIITLFIVYGESESDLLVAGRG